MRPGIYDFTVQRGGSGEVSIRLATMDEEGVRTPMDLTGSAFVLSVIWPSGALRKASADGGLTVDLASSQVSWRPPPAEARLIPEGRIARYELEQREAGGGQRILLSGYMIGEGGLNDD